MNLNLQQFAAGVLSKGTVLSYKSAAAFVPIAGVKSVPQIGSDPERIDVTTLDDAKRKYISGLQDTENLEFAVIYQTTNFSTFQTFAATATDATEFELAYPDGMKVTFSGKPSVKINATEVNAAMEFSITIVVSDGPDIVPVV